jgi:hypothetical protein
VKSPGTSTPVAHSKHRLSIQETAMRRSSHIFALIAGSLFAGCANYASIVPGTSAPAVEANSGKPFRVWPEAGGGSTWEYPMGPEGRYTYMVRLGPDNRVSRVDQVLDWTTFGRIHKGMPMSDVEHLIGRPYSKVEYPRTDQVAWAWRFVEGVTRRCFYVYEGRDGRVAGTGARDEWPGRPIAGLAEPC